MKYRGFFMYRLRPRNAAALAATLKDYPAGIVRECCDPRSGLAREREFPPTVAAIVEWCDRRLAWRQSVASYVARPQLPAREFTYEEREDGQAALCGLRKTIAEKGDVAALTFEQAIELGKTAMMDGRHEVDKQEARR